MSVFFFSSRRRHTRFDCDWSSDVCSSDLVEVIVLEVDSAGRRIQLSRKAVLEAGEKREGREYAEQQGQARPGRFEIGRASGRGKGEISVGAASFKKKKKEVRYRCGDVQEL